MREQMWQQAMNHPKPVVQHPEDRLTDRELEVYTLIGQGMTTQQIAEGLHVSPKTVQTYRNHIKEKLSIETAAELIHRAAIWSADRQRPRLEVGLVWPGGQNRLAGDGEFLIRQARCAAEPRRLQASPGLIILMSSFSSGRRF
ncbi:MAG: helix-turn-helix transcriptional regulator [Candidatus Moduliflexus flocculans]|nr:helix-turn-helix transcriptional regulator [Candidatus Moduliflexus flocculans]